MIKQWLEKRRRNAADAQFRMGFLCAVDRKQFRDGPPLMSDADLEVAVKKHRAFWDGYSTGLFVSNPNEIEQKRRLARDPI